MMARAPKAPPIMAPIGTSDFPCVAVIAPTVAPSEEDRCVKDDAGDDPGEASGEIAGENNREGFVANVRVGEEDEDDGEDCSVEKDGCDVSDDGEGGEGVTCTIAKESM